MNRRSPVAVVAAAPALAAPATPRTTNPVVRRRPAGSFPRGLDIPFFGSEQAGRRVAENA